LHHRSKYRNKPLGAGSYAGKFGLYRSGHDRKRRKQDCAEIAKLLRQTGSVSAYRVKQTTSGPGSTAGIVFFKTIFNGWVVGIVTPTANYYRDVYITGWMTGFALHSQTSCLLIPGRGFC
jgi:hypothetical protein